MKKYISAFLLLLGVGMIAVGVYRILMFNKEQQMDLQKVFEYQGMEYISADSNVTGQQGSTGEAVRPAEKVMTRKGFENGMMAILIPKIKVKAAVMNGTELATLKKGPGLYKESDLPSSEKGNVCIAAHNDTYFKSIYKLQKNDEIDLVFLGNMFIYKVVDVETIEKYDWSPIKTTEKPSITLTTCHPETGNKQRIAVRGELYTVKKVENKGL